MLCVAALCTVIGFGDLKMNSKVSMGNVTSVSKTTVSYISRGLTKQS